MTFQAHTPITDIPPRKSVVPRPARKTYPFTAIVGQDLMKLGLILNAVNPNVGGLLIRGEKGTAKSTAVRALAGILPEIDVVADCPYSCDPRDVKGLCPSCRSRRITTAGRTVRVAEFPLNATEEMVIGGLDFSASIGLGAAVFQPGLMARANRGILYIDEVNLLPDHLVDVILDVAASGENVVQREGVSHRHPADFILVGSMNPEEGELRPQLLDRFGLCVDVGGERDLAARVEVLQRRQRFDRSPLAFAREFEDKDQLLADRIAHARLRLPKISFPVELNDLISRICLDHNVAGHRADIVIAHAAKALAAFESRDAVTAEDIRRAAFPAIIHRRRPSAQTENVSEEANKYNSSGYPKTPSGYPEEYPECEPDRVGRRDPNGEKMDCGPARRLIPRSEFSEAIFEVGQTFKVKELGQNADRQFRQGSGKRSRTQTRQKKGRYVRSTADRVNDDIALDATIRAAAPYQLMRKAENGLAVVIRDDDIREKIRETRTGNFLLFIVDASGSMGAKGRMVASKGAIMSLLKDAYLKRDRVAMVSFRKQQAVVNLPPTSSMHRAGELLKELPVGGKTPLASGLRKGQGLLRNVLLKDPTCRPILIIITDGKANESVGKGDPFWEALSVAKELGADKRLRSIVVDAEEEGGFLYGHSARLAEVMRAEYFKIKDLRADILLDIVRTGA
jgi:magnesium chelatase subunit D